MLPGASSLSLSVSLFLLSFKFLFCCFSPGLQVPKDCQQNVVFQIIFLAMLWEEVGTLWGPGCREGSLFNSYACLSTGYRGPRCIHNHSSHSAGNFPHDLHLRVHGVRLQEAATCVFPGDLGLSPCHGLPLHVFWGHYLSMGPGKIDLQSETNL